MQRTRSRDIQFLAVMGLGYLLILISTLPFLAILQVNSKPSEAPFDITHVTPMDGRSWVDWEREYAETTVPVGVTTEADYRFDMAYNFSMLPIHVRVTNDWNVTIPSFAVLVLVEDNTGHIRGSGGAAPKVSAHAAQISEEVFIYNVPATLRGQELRIHVISFIQQNMTVGKQMLMARTFPNLEMRELPRILLFFLTFSTLPVSVFLPPTLKKLAEDWWRLMLEKDLRAAILLIVFFAIGLAVYWDYVCKVFCFL
jgi:hypothetical protein